jgi:hypothetical protein
LLGVEWYLSYEKYKGLFGARELKILDFTENYLPMGRYFLKKMWAGNYSQPNMLQYLSQGLRY